MVMSPLPLLLIISVLFTNGGDVNLQTSQLCDLEPGDLD